MIKSKYTEYIKIINIYFDKLNVHDELCKKQDSFDITPIEKKIIKKRLSRHFKSFLDWRKKQPKIVVDCCIGYLRRTIPLKNFIEKYEVEVK